MTDGEVTCDCIYIDEVHPECDRANPTVLVDLGNRTTAAMCRWCADDWKRRHPDMQILALDEAGSGVVSP